MVIATKKPYSYSVFIIKVVDVQQVLPPSELAPFDLVAMCDINCGIQGPFVQGGPKQDHQGIKACQSEGKEK